MAINWNGVGNAVKGGVYHLTTGGLDHLGHSVGLRNTAFKTVEELGWGGTAIRTALAPPLFALNVAAHAGAVGVRGARAVGSGYMELWAKHPWGAALATTAIAAPVAYSMLDHGGHNKHRAHAKERMDELAAQQQQTQQVLDTLQQMEAMQQPQPQPVVPQVVDIPAAMRAASSSIPSPANDAVYQGRVDGLQISQAAQR